MSLVERLGYKTLKDLYAEMDGNDIMEWVAYDMIQQPDLRKRLEKEILMEAQKSFTNEQEADAIKAMLASLGRP